RPSTTTSSTRRHRPSTALPSARARWRSGSRSSPASLRSSPPGDGDAVGIVGTASEPMPAPAEPPIEVPATLAEAYAVLAGSTADEPITPIAGGTDVMVRISGEIGEPPARLVDLSRLGELRGIAADGRAIVIGACATYSDIRRSDLCREHLPALVGAAATIGAAQIQNRGTVGGNIANAPPDGDT